MAALPVIPGRSASIEPPCAIAHLSSRYRAPRNDGLLAVSIESDYVVVDLQGLADFYRERFTAGAGTFHLIPKPVIPRTWQDRRD